MAPDPDQPDRPRLLGGSAFLVESAAFSRGSGRIDAGGAAGAAHLELRDRNAAAVDLLRNRHAGEAGAADGALLAVAGDCARALGPHHPDTLIAAGNRAVGRALAGRPAEALELLEANLAAREVVFGAVHPRTLDARDALGTVLRLVGRFADARSVHAQVVEQRRAALGAHHPDTVVSRLGLALDHAESGHLDAAAADLQDLLRACVTLGACHPVTRAVRLADADVALARGLVDRGVKQLQLACAATGTALGRYHPDAVALHAELRAVLAERAGRGG